MKLQLAGWVPGARARRVVMLVFLVAVLPGVSATSQTGDSVASAGNAQIERRATIEALFPTDPSRMMNQFGHLRTATVEQVVDSILILERNGRFPEADELRRQFLDGRVGLGRDPFAAVAEAEAAARRERLAALRAQLSHQNARFLALMASRTPWPPAERLAYQALVEELLALLQLPAIPEEERRQTRRELLESVLQSRAARFGR